MDNCRERMINDMQLCGYSERTQESYWRAVRQLEDFSKKSPELITEEELREYLLHIKNKRKYAAPTMKIAYYGIKFFYKTTLKKSWDTLVLLRAESERRLPISILRREEKKPSAVPDGKIINFPDDICHEKNAKNEKEEGNEEEQVVSAVSGEEEKDIREDGSGD